jgi:hypothetical protein
MITAIAVLCSSQANSQTTSTGALTGVALDPSGAVLPSVPVSLANQDSGATKSANSDEGRRGRLTFLLLPPGRYEVRATSAGSEGLVGGGTINASLSETLRGDLHLQLATNPMTEQRPRSAKLSGGILCGAYRRASSVITARSLSTQSRDSQYVETTRLGISPVVEARPESLNKTTESAQGCAGMGLKRNSTVLLHGISEEVTIWHFASCSKPRS